MPRYATVGDIRARQSQLLTEEKRRIMVQAATRSSVGATFLSHSSRDVELLPGVIKLLEGHGATVYIDKKDPDLPPFTSRETAAVLRQRIRQSKKFILFATSTSKDSRWMPWELGLSDGLKGAAETAVLPAVDTVTDTKWTEREYLGTYNRVVFGKLSGYPEDVWMVWNQEKDTATRLSDWLQA